MSARPIVAFCTILVAGCADLLGIPDRYYDGGVQPDEGGLPEAAPDAPTVDAPASDGSSSCSSCASYGSGCEVLDCHQSVPIAVAVDGTRVFWADSVPLGNDNAIGSSDVAGGNFAQSQVGGTELGSLVVAGGSVYASELDLGAVVQVPSNGGSPTPIASAADAYALATDGSGNLAYATFSNGGEVVYCGSPAQCDAGTVVITGQANVQGLALDDAAVYWSSTSAGGGIFSCARDHVCGAPVLVSSATAPTLVAVDATSVYWVDGQDVWRGSKTVPGNGQGIVGAASTITAIALDGNDLYYATLGTGPSTGKISRVHTDGSGQQDLAVGLASGGGVAVDATYVYFSEWGPYVEGGLDTDGRIMRMPK